MALDEAPSAKISRNLEKILSILIFLALKAGFSAQRVAPLGALIIGRSPRGKLYIF